MNKHHPYRKFISGLKFVKDHVEKKRKEEGPKLEPMTPEQHVAAQVRKTANELGVPPRIFQGAPPLPIIHREFSFDLRDIWASGPQIVNRMSRTMGMMGSIEDMVFRHSRTCVVCNTAVEPQGNLKEDRFISWHCGICTMWCAEIASSVELPANTGRRVHYVQVLGIHRPGRTLLFDFAGMQKKRDEETAELVPFGQIAFERLYKNANVDAESEMLAMLAEIRKAPRSQQSTGWLVFADWLDEHGCAELADEHRRLWG